MSPFLQDLVPNLLGSAFGVGLALFVDRWREAHRRQREKEAAQHEREEATASQLRIVQWLTEENVELARQGVAVLDSNSMFFFPMNTHLLDTALVSLSTLCDDLELLWKAEHFRYQLHHVNAKIRAYTEAATFQVRLIRSRGRGAPHGLRERRRAP